MSDINSNGPDGAGQNIPEHLMNPTDISSLQQQVNGIEEKKDVDVDTGEEGIESNIQSDFNNDNALQYDKDDTINNEEDGEEGDDGDTELDESEYELTPEEEALLEQERFEEEFSEVLSEFGIEDGLVQLGEDEEPVEFSKLDDESQKFVLKNLLLEASETTKALREQDSESERNVTNELTEDEITFINKLREDNLSPEDYLKQFQEQASQQAMPDVNGDISKLSPEEVFKYDYIMNLPEEVIDGLGEENLTDIINEELAEAKKSKTFEPRMKNMQSAYVKQQEQQLEIKQQQEQAKIEEQLEAQKEEFVKRTYGIDEIGSFEINNEIKEELYSKLLDVDEEGFTPFQRELMSSPEKAFKAAYYAYYGEHNEQELIRQILGEQKEQKSKARKFSKFPKKPISKKGSSKPGKRVTAGGSIRTGVDKDSVAKKPSVNELHRMFYNN